MAGTVKYPVALSYLYQWARELDARRRYGAGGPERITYTDMKAWAELTGRTPDADELMALGDLTDAMIPPSEPKPMADTMPRRRKGRR